MLYGTKIVVGYISNTFHRKVIQKAAWMDFALESNVTYYKWKWKTSRPRGTQIFQKLEYTLEFQEPEIWHETNSILKTHKY